MFRKITIKPICILFLLTCITLFALKPLQSTVEAKEQSITEIEEQGILSPALLVCGDGRQFAFYIEIFPSGKYVYQNQDSGNTYDSGARLARSYRCMRDYKIYQIVLYAMFIDCGPDGEYRNEGLLMDVHDSSPGTTVSLPSTIWVVPTGHHTGVYSSIEEYHDTNPYDCSVITLDPAPPLES